MVIGLVDMTSATGTKFGAAWPARIGVSSAIIGLVDKQKRTYLSAHGFMVRIGHM